MLILGLTKTTLLDYPGKVAATIFTGGCNFRCPFCHNGGLVIDSKDMPIISEEEILSHLTKRRGILQGVCISGGEPTLYNDLPDFLQKVKSLGYEIKLDTNGSFPKRLAKLIDGGLVDYIAMDIKNCKDKYARTAGCDDLEIKDISESIKLIKSSNIPFEFRTTIVKELHTLKDLLEIREWIGEVPWYLQSYKDSPSVIQEGLNGYKEAELRNMLKEIKEKNGTNTVWLRGVE